MSAHGLPPQVQPVQHLPRLPVGEEVQRTDQPLAAGGHRPGDVEDRRTADTVFSEQHLAAVLRHTLAAPEDGDAALGLDALQRPGIGGIGPQLHQGGIQHGAVVSQHFGKTIAVHDAAYFAAGGPAGGQYDLPRGKDLRLGPDGEALRYSLYGGDRLPGADPDAGALQRVAQHVQHTAGHVAHGVDAAAVLTDRQQSQ